MAPASKAGIRPLGPAAAESLWVTEYAARFRQNIFVSVVQTGSASLCGSGQAPIFVVNCLNNNKWCCSDDLCVPLLDLICMVRTGY